MENKETSIEWLMGQALGWVKDKNNGNDHIVFPKGAIQQAKEMEKKNIKDAFIEGDNNGLDYYNPMTKTLTSEQYYNEAYGGNK